MGAYSADLLFQIFRVCGVFVAGGAVGIVGIPVVAGAERSIRRRRRSAGYVLLLLSLPSLLALFHFWNVRGALPAGGLLGALVSHGLQSGFNLWGAFLVAIALLIVALFLTTSFSFQRGACLGQRRKGPIGKMEKLGILQRAQARWHAWRDEREAERGCGVRWKSGGWRDANQ